MENTSPTAFLGVSLLVVAVSVFPQICQAGLAEKNYLSSSVRKSPGGCVVSEHVAPAAPCWMFGCFGFLDNKPGAWEALPGLCHHEVSGACRRKFQVS